MEPGITELEVSALLRRACAEAGGNKAWADRYDVSPQYVGQVIGADRPPSDRILSALGLRKIVRFVAKQNA